jgi:hypothetical protein
VRDRSPVLHSLGQSWTESHLCPIDTVLDSFGQNLIFLCRLQVLDSTVTAPNHHPVLYSTQVLFSAEPIINNYTDNSDYTVLDNSEQQEPWAVALMTCPKLSKATQPKTGHPKFADVVPGATELGVGVRGLREPRDLLRSGVQISSLHLKAQTLAVSYPCVRDRTGPNLDMQKCQNRHLERF